VHGRRLFREPQEEDVEPGILPTFPLPTDRVGYRRASCPACRCWLRLTAAARAQAGKFATAHGNVGSAAEGGVNEARRLLRTTGSRRQLLPGVPEEKLAAPNGAPGSPKNAWVRRWPSSPATTRS
jgi:hypothetical protein